MKVKEESENVGLKLNMQKMKIMASGLVTSWEMDGETVSDFIFLGSKITAPTLSGPMDCSLPGSSIHGIFQARVLEWGAIAFSGREWGNLKDQLIVMAEGFFIYFIALIRNSSKDSKLTLIMSII